MAAGTAAVRPVFGLWRHAPAFGAHPAGVAGVDFRELPTGLFCLIAKLVPQNPPSLCQYLQVQSRLGGDVMPRLFHCVRRDPCHVPDFQLLDGDSSEPPHNVRGNEVAFVPVADRCVVSLSTASPPSCAAVCCPSPCRRRLGATTFPSSGQSTVAPPSRPWTARCGCSLPSPLL